MTINDVAQITSDALFCVIKTSAPILIVSLVVGLIVSIFQTVTSIQEQTLTFVPKLIAILIGIMVMGTWILNEIVAFMNTLWGSFSQYIS